MASTSNTTVPSSYPLSQLSPATREFHPKKSRRQRSYQSAKQKAEEAATRCFSHATPQESFRPASSRVSPTISPTTRRFSVHISPPPQYHNYINQESPPPPYSCYPLPTQPVYPYPYSYYPLTTQPVYPYPSEPFNPYACHPPSDRSHLSYLPTPKPFITLYPTDGPSLSCPETLTPQHLGVLQSILSKKVQIKLNRNSTALNLTEIIGEVTIDEFISLFKRNIEVYFPKMAADFRLAGSGANSVLFNKPKATELRDVDLVFYLKDAPRLNHEISQFLSSIARIFENTMATFVNPEIGFPEDDIPSIIHNHYLTNRMIITKDENKWMLIGFGILDLRINIQTKREYTSSTYSHQISLLPDNQQSYCLYGDREKAREHFKEDRLVIPNPQDMLNGLGRVLHELNRHSSYSIKEIAVVTEKYLKDNSTDHLIMSLNQHYNDSLSKAKALKNITTILQAVMTLKIDEKEDVVARVISNLLRTISPESSSSTFEENINLFIKKLIDHENHNSAYDLLKIFHKNTDISVAKSYVYFIKALTQKEDENPALFSNLLKMGNILDISDTESLYLDILKEIKTKYAYLNIISKRAYLKDLFINKKSSFYFDTIKFLANSKIKQHIDKAFEIFIKTEDIFTSSAAINLKDLLIEGYLKTIHAPPKELLKPSDIHFSPQRRNFISNILKDVYQKNISAPMLEYIYLTLLEYRKDKSFLTITKETAQHISYIYTLKIKEAPSTDLPLEIYDDILKHPFISKNRDLITVAFKNIQDITTTLSLQEATTIINFINRIIDKHKNLSSEINLKKGVINLLQNIPDFSDAEEKKTKKIVKKYYETYIKSTKIITYSQNEGSTLLLSLVSAWLDNGFIVEARNLLFENLQFIENKNKLTDIITKIFSKLSPKECLDTFEKKEDLLSLYINEKSLSKLYLMILQKISALDKDDKTLKNEIKLLEKVFFKKFHWQQSWKNYISSYISSYSPCNFTKELDRKELKILTLLVKDEKTPISNKTRLEFNKKCFSNYFKLSLQSHLPAYLNKAFEIFDTNPKIQKQLVPIVINYLTTLSTKEETINTIYSVTLKLDHLLNEPFMQSYAIDFNNILIEQKPTDLITSMLYIALLDKLTSKGFTSLNNKQITKVIIEHLEDTIVRGENDPLERKDTLNTLTHLLSLKFWSAPILQKKKTELVLSHIYSYQNNIENMESLNSLLSKQLDIFSALENKQKLSKISITEKQEEKLNELVASWITQADNHRQCQLISCFYHRLINNQLINTSLDKKLKIYELFQGKLMSGFLSIIKKTEELSVEMITSQSNILLAENLIAWAHIIKEHYDELSQETFLSESKFLINILEHSYPTENHEGITAFYQILEQKNALPLFDELLKKIGSFPLQYLISPDKKTLLPPQVIIETILYSKHLF